MRWLKEALLLLGFLWLSACSSFSLPGSSQPSAPPSDTPPGPSASSAATPDLLKIVTDDPKSLALHVERQGWSVWPSDAIPEPQRHDLETVCKREKPEEAANYHLLGVAVRWGETRLICYNDYPPSVDGGRLLCAQVGRSLWEVEPTTRTVTCAPRRSL